MSIRTAVLCATLGLAALAAPMFGSARVYVDVDVAPPAPQVEVIPEARVGYVWAPGYWDWDGHHHVWTKGRYIKEHHGHHWVNDTWVQRDGHWHHEVGHWD
jgi:WXXGXW repeat (2 copies)